MTELCENLRAVLLFVGVPINARPGDLLQIVNGVCVGVRHSTKPLVPGRTAIQRIVQVMLDGRWRTIREVAALTGDAAQVVAARMRIDLKDCMEAMPVARGEWKYRYHRDPLETT